MRRTAGIRPAMRSPSRREAPGPRLGLRPPVRTGRKSRGMRSPSRGLVLGLGSALAGQAIRGGGLAVVADALLQARRQVGQVARGAGVEDRKSTRLNSSH